METVSTNSPISAAAQHLATTIKTHLDAGEHVLWFLSGGSGIEVVLETDKLLAGTDLTNLSVTLSDERFGNIGHPDENWQLLLDGGLSLTGATLYRPLINQECQITTDEFGAWVMQVMSVADYAIGLFGIGVDGHTAGIKPHSPATETSAWASCFKADDFERITISPLAISHLNEAIIQASGQSKQPVLHDLLHASVDVVDQPMHILKSVPKSTLYTNIKDL